MDGSRQGSTGMGSTCMGSTDALVADAFKAGHKVGFKAGHIAGRDWNDSDEEW